METNKKKMTREEAMRRFMAAKQRKREYIVELEARMKAEYKMRTGNEATYFEVW